MKKYVAGLVSVPKYKSSTIRDLPFCAKDCNLLTEVLTKNLGVEEENIRSLGTDINETVKKTDIIRLLKFVSRKAEPDDMAILYFTGHGFSENNIGYLTSFDTELDLVSDTSISIIVTHLSFGTFEPLS